MIKRFYRTFGDGPFEIRLERFLGSNVVIHALLKKAKRASAIPLCAIHRNIGCVKQAFGIGTVLMAGCNPNTSAELDAPFTDQDRFSDSAQHFAREVPCSVQIDLLGHIALRDDRKLVASQASHRAAVPDDPLEPSRDFAQHRVAERLALQVIDPLELV